MSFSSSINIYVKNITDLGKEGYNDDALREIESIISIFKVLEECTAKAKIRDIPWHKVSLVDAPPNLHTSSHRKTFASTPSACPIQPSVHLPHPTCGHPLLQVLYLHSVCLSSLLWNAHLPCAPLWHSQTVTRSTDPFIPPVSHILLPSS